MNKAVEQALQTAKDLVVGSYRQLRDDPSLDTPSNPVYQRQVACLRIAKDAIWEALEAEAKIKLNA